MTLADLQHQLLARTREEDLSPTLTPRERREYIDSTAALEQRIAGIVAEQNIIAERSARRAAFAASLARLRAAETALVAELETGQRHQELLTSLHVVRHGGVLPAPLRALLTDVCPTCGHREPVAWPGSIDRLEQEVATLDASIASIQASLDVKLLPDAERAKVEATARAERARQDAAPQRITRGDGTQFDRYPNGHEVPVAE